MFAFDRERILADARRLRTLDADAVALAQTLGWQVERDAEAWVAFVPPVLHIAPDEGLDGDDTLVQIVLHEVCHFLVEGPASAQAWDWGLDNTDDRHVSHEHAALRLQATLADRFGLREALVATTDFRPWYEALDAAPLDGDGSGAELARAGFVRWQAWEGRAALDGLLRAAASVLHHGPSPAATEAPPW